MSKQSRANALYVKYYKQLRLAPKHVAALKQVLLGALESGNKPRAQAKAWLKSRGLGLPKDKTKKDKTKKDKDVEKGKPVVDYAKLDLKNLDRKSLKAVLEELRSAGVKVRVPLTSDGTPKIKQMADHELLRAVSEAINSLPSPETLATLERIDPQKLADTLKKDCLGVFIDLTTPECLACPDKAQCAKEFIRNLKGNFKALKDAQTEIKVTEQASAVTEEVLAAAERTNTNVKTKNKIRRLKYDGDTVVFIMNIKNPEKKSSEAYDLVAAILKRAHGSDFAPITMKRLLVLVNEYYDYKPEALVEELLPQLRTEGVIKFLADLTDEERVAYNDAI